MFYVYMLRCRDESLYTGITSHPVRRMREHFLQKKACARYTRMHPPVYIERIWEVGNREQASRLEYRIKKLTRAEKERLLTGKDPELAEHLDIPSCRALSEKETAEIYDQVLPEQKHSV